MVPEDSPSRSSWLLSLFTLAAFICPAYAYAQPFPVESAFDADEEGWSIYIGGVITWQAGGGNPDGYLETQDDDPSSGTLISAPPDYLGDWRSLDGTGAIELDLIFIDDPDFYPVSGVTKILLYSLSDTAYYTGTSGPTTSWKRFCAPLDESQWTMQSGNWLSLLSDVTDFLVLMDFTNGRDINGMDNVYVGQSAGGGVPIPAWCEVSCLSVCPAGDFDFTVIVREGCGWPLGGAEVVVDFSACDSVTLCEPDTVTFYVLDPDNKTITATTDANGEVVLPIQGGGISYLSAVQVRAEGVLIADRPVASCDQDGDLQVGPFDQVLIAPKFASGEPDPTADFDCDSTVGVSDAAIFVLHFNEQHQCTAPVVVSPAHSTVDNCLVIEPDGGYDFDVVVRDQSGVPISGVPVVVDFSACPGVQLCSPGGGEPYVRVDSLAVSATTAGDGSVTFPIRGGGACADSLAEIRVATTVLARRSVASPDQSGNLLVYSEDFPLLRDKLLNHPLDPSGDLDCDGLVTPADSVELLVSWKNQCCGSVTGPDPCRSVVPECLVSCPGGDLLFQAEVFNANEEPITDVDFELDLMGCPDVFHCHPGESLPGEWEFRSERKLVLRTDAAGWVGSPLRAGGQCRDTAAVVSVDGMILGRLPIKSTDFDGDLSVGSPDSAYFTERYLSPEYDPEIDLDCDGEEDFDDFRIMGNHLGAAHSCLTGVDVKLPPQTPRVFALHGGIPNPTRDGAVIGFDLPVKTSVILRVCDVRGRIIRTALDAREMPAGSHVWEWDGRDDGGVRVAAGVYFYYLETPQHRSTRKAVVLQ